MKKLILSVSVIFAILANSVFAYAATVYIPSADSSQYLPTVKILTYSLFYDGSLVVEGSGSGTIIDSRGTILTNAHVVRSLYDPTLPADAFQICLTRSNAPESPVCEFVASFVAMHDTQDLALLRMSPTDARGNTVTFDFNLPYKNSGNPAVGDSLTAIGFPDIGGKTITYTTGVVSGFLQEYGVNYMKTDAVISFGNSGGTTVDENGNFVGVPTLGVSSDSLSSLGYLLPVKDFVTWIDQKIGLSVAKDDIAKDKLFAAEKASVSANSTGTFKNADPSYEISVVSDWKFSNSLDEAFSNPNNVVGSYYGTNSVVIVPKDDSLLSTGRIEIFFTDFSYVVEMSDLEYFLQSYAVDNPDIKLEVVKLNGKYDAYKESMVSYDWETGATFDIVTYYIPYGNRVVSLRYIYDDASFVADLESMVKTFKID
ncbi:S1C family serine protease, partial [Candidatus Gracilibacteria bacterium]|nr:S1C family serine protease [Candidatus Gracilibacteria bacterium]